MRLDDHPFRILDIGTRTKKAVILGRVQSLLLTEDSERIQTLAATVTHPAKRIDAEVSWFPGVNPAQLTQLLSAIDKDKHLPAHVEQAFRGLNALSYFNLVYFWTTGRSDLKRRDWIVALQNLAIHSPKIKLPEVVELLNADRTAAGIPQIVDENQVAVALKRRLDNVADTTLSHLLQRTGHAIIVSRLLNRATASGRNFSNDFVYRFADQYATAIQPELTGLRDSICGSCSCMARGEHDAAAVEKHLADLETLTRRWAEATAGIQLAMQSRGLEDPATAELGRRVRSNALDIGNKRHLYAEARRITVMLQEACRHTPSVTDILSTDIKALDAIIEKVQREAVSTAVRDLMKLCVGIREECSAKIVRNDGSAGANKKVCDAALQRFRQDIERPLKNLPAQGQGIRKAQECAAQCLSSIATQYTWAEDFVASELLHTEALHWAQAAEGVAGETWTMSSAAPQSRTAAIRDAIEKVRPTAHRQRLLAGTKQISLPPSLTKVNGVGFTLYGNTDYDEQTKSHIATYYFVFFFIPILPIARYRVSRTNGNRYRFLGKLPLRRSQRWHLGIAAALLGALAILIAAGVIHIPGTDRTRSSELRSLKSQIDSGSVKTPGHHTQTDSGSTRVSPVATRPTRTGFGDAARQKAGAVPD